MTKLATRHLYGVEVDAGTRTIEWRESAVDLSATIAEGTYYAFTGTLSGYTALYTAIAAAMTAESLASGDANTYVIEAATPTLSTEQPMAGVRIRETGGASWELKRLCAINALGVLGVASSGASYLASSSGIVTGEWTAWGAWVPPTLGEEWRRNPRRQIAWSTEDTEREDFYAVYGGERWERRFVWRDILAGHVRAARALLPDYAESAGLDEGDVYNAYEDLWSWGSRGGAVITCWFDDAASIDLTIPASAYEIGRLGDLEAARRLDAGARLVRPNGEYYDVELVLSRLTGGYAQ